MTDPVMETLLAAETVAAVVELGRRSRTRPAVMARQLTDYARQARDARPAAAAAAAFLAGVFTELEHAQPWPGQDHLPPAVNEVLRRASVADGWPGALNVLREHRSLLTEDVLMSVLAWHAELAERGVPPEANGAALAITLGALLGGHSLGYVHMAWARAVEDTPARAEFHLRRGQALLAGDEQGTGVAAAALDAYADRSGTGAARHAAPVPDGPVNPMQVPVAEATSVSLRNSGRYREALALLDRTIPLAVAAGLDTNAMRMLSVRGLVHDDLSEYARAEADFQDAASLAHRLGDEARRFEALNNAAASYLKRGQPLRAVPAFREILRDADNSGAQGKRIAARNNLATACASAGDDAAARDLYAEALDLLGDATGESRWIALSGLISAYDSLGQHAERDALGRQLWRAWVQEGNQRALLTYLHSRARDFANPQMRSMAEQVCEAMLRRGDLFQAGSLSLALAKHDREHDPQRALARLDIFLDTFDSERSAVKLGIHAELEAAALEAGVLGRADATLDRLWAAVERSEERLEQVEVPAAGDWLLDTTRPLYLELLDQLLRNDSVAEALWVHEAARPITLTSAYQPTGRQNRIATPDDVDRVLAGSTERHLAIVSFAETASTVGSFVLRAGQEPVWVALPIDAAELDAAAAQLSLAFNGDSSMFPPRRPIAATRLHAADLGRAEQVLAALGEILPHVAGADLVCMVPSASMEGLPLHALRSPSGRLLVQDASVIYQASLSSFVATADTPPPVRAPRHVFVAGVAAAEDAHPDFFEADAHVFDRVDVTVTTAAGTAATPTSVLAGLRTAEVAHLACHGFVDHRDPLGSGLLLSDGQRRPSRRPQSVPIFERAAFELTVRDLMRHTLTTQLLTLRACSTARRSAISAKEEMATLTRVLQAAGCATVVSTLWNVDQRSSLHLFERFYTLYLDDHLPACDAMARAQQELIAEGQPHAHLYHWAPFIVSGDWRQETP